MEGCRVFRPYGMETVQNMEILQICCRQPDKHKLLILNYVNDSNGIDLDVWRRGRDSNPR